MHLKKVSITNIKSIKSLSIDFDEPYAGWHVLLGENGAGKTTILKAISLCLLGERQAYTLPQNFANWITKGEKNASCQIDLILNEGFDSIYKKGKEISFCLKINLEGNLSFTTIINSGASSTPNNNYPQAEKGWYSAAFGPFRKIGLIQTKSLSNFADGNLSNHITLFDANYSLSEGVDWLKNLKFEKLDKPSKDNAFDQIIWFINESDLLPNGVRIDEVNPKGVFFQDGKHKGIGIEEMSDGYQSIFSLTLEILRQIQAKSNFKKVVKKRKGNYTIDFPGIILIDEVDAHLHPQWQAKIGEWFKQFFPKIQFIVSTHSPIICQSAENGSIWKVQHSNTNELSYRVKDQDFKRMVYGSISDAIGTDSFGQKLIERSDKSKEMLDRLAELNMKSIRGIASSEENDELKYLKSILPSA